MSLASAPIESGHAHQGHGLDRGILVLGGVIALGAIMSILDATIVNVAVPTLGREFQTSISTIQWVLTGYLLAFAAVIPLTGWACQRLGAKRVWITALLLFMAGSILAGLAWSIEALILFRILQGLGGGLILPVGQTILAQAAGPQRMGRVMSIVGVPMLLGPVLGPVLGGVLVDQVSWRWIFFVNLPVGAAAILLARRLLPDTERRPGARLDRRGLALLSPGIAVFVFGMSEAGTRGGFANATTFITAGIGMALVVLFVRHALGRGRAALIDVTLFFQRGFATAAATDLLLGIALFGSLILLPLYYQLARGESALTTGLLLMPQGLGAAIAMPLAGWLTDRVGARIVVPTGVAVALAGMVAFTTVAPDTPYPTLAGALFVIGVGLGSTIMPSMAVAYQTVSRDAVAGATSALNVIQRIAGSLGTALLAVLLQRSIDSRLPGLEGGIRAIDALSPQERTPAEAALADAFGTTFWVAVALLATALIPALLLPGVRRHAPTATAAAGEAGPAG
jgi:EmrB/QacA subfamily drug resistance transporter